MDAAYLRAANPEPFTILSTRLERFCLGHEILLQRFGNRFSVEKRNPENPPDSTDLPLAVYICSRPYSQDFSFDGFRIPLRARVWNSLFGQAYLEKAVAIFHKYIAAHTEVPEFYELGEESDKKPCGTPMVQSVKVSLEANLGRSTEKSLNTSFSLAFWDHLTFYANQGQIQIIDEAEKARIAEEEKIRAETEAQIEELKQKLFPGVKWATV